MIEAIAEALEHHQAGRRDEAEALYRQVLTRDPRDPTGLYLYGLFNFEGGRVDAAADLFKSLIKVRPDHAEGHVALANLRHWQDAHGVAIEGYRRALALAPDHAGALLGLTTALREMGDLAAALSAAREAVNRLPENPDARLAEAGVLMAADRAEEAAESYRVALALAPDVIDAHNGLALALLHLGQVQAALETADEALRRSPRSGEAWFLLGTALNTLGQTEEAIAALERAAAIDPDRAGVHLNLASLQRALDLDPVMKEAHASLGSVLLRGGQPEAAEYHCRLALELDPDMVVAHQNLAALLDERGEAEEARAHRDQVYGRQNLFIEPARASERTVLILTTAASGNVPHRDLLPRQRYTRLNWFIEYASPGQALPPHDAVFNAIGDADLAGPADAPMRAFLASSPLPVINHPDRVALTKRDNLPALLAGIDGLCVPPVARLTAADMASEGLAACVARAGLAPPVLLRPVGSHGGRGLVRAKRLADLEDFPITPGHDAYVTAFQDFTSADGWLRKYRMIFVDRRPYPYHLAISHDWLVHYESAGMPDDPARVAEERRFLEDPAAVLGPAAMAAVTRIGERMDLDYCGVDFSLLPDGRVLVFEANATMLAHRELENGPLAHKNPWVEAICSAFQALLYRC
jgi:tetratricopeptide (TPR) repeat protein